LLSSCVHNCFSMEPNAILGILEGNLVIVATRCTVDALCIPQEGTESRISPSIQSIIFINEDIAHVCTCLSQIMIEIYVRYATQFVESLCRASEKCTTSFSEVCDGDSTTSALLS